MITVIAISNLYTTPLTQIYIPCGDILIVAGDLSKGRPVQLMERLSELQTLPHKVKIVISGNHYRTLDASCDTYGMVECDDLDERHSGERRSSGFCTLNTKAWRLWCEGELLRCMDRQNHWHGQKHCFWILGQ
jgi:hypothetical protein